MKISFKAFIGFFLVSILCLGLWYKFGYPKLIFMDMVVDKSQAMVKAQDYLVNSGISLKGYNKAVVFHDDEWADRYLQRTLGLQKQENFLKQEDVDIFYWRVRFFKQYQKEEFIIKVSPVSGKILGVEHLIDDIEPRVDIGKEAARAKAEVFLKQSADFSVDKYDFHKEEAKRYDNRLDYIFTWEKKGVNVPWEKDQGDAKLLIGATVSGDEVREFYVSKIDIPEKFKRYIEKQLIFGQYLASFSLLCLILFIMFATFTTVNRRSQLTIRLNNKLYFWLAGIIVVLNISNIFNGFEMMASYYPTSVNFNSYLWLNLLKAFLGIIFFAAAFIFPGLAGESLRQEYLPEAKYSSFLHFIKSTFCSRIVFKSIIFGYFIFFIMLGVQAVMFYWGQKYFGVWKEWIRLTQYSSSYIPFFAAFVVGVSASLNEEVLFRLFGISWGMKLFKNLFLAVIFSSLVWGFGHSFYAIFPVWFRGIEVGILGVFLGYVFIRYGLIPVLVAHFLFDLFWGVTSYIFGVSPAYLFYGSLLMIFLPLVFAVLAYGLNREDKEKPSKYLLDSQQKYNLEILNGYISLRKSQGYDYHKLKAELLKNSWDPDLVNLSLEEVYHGNN